MMTCPQLLDPPLGSKARVKEQAYWWLSENERKENRTQRETKILAVSIAAPVSLHVADCLLHFRQTPQFYISILL